jgi:membrane protease YdiL (CAAX protease family)
VAEPISGKFNLKAVFGLVIFFIVVFVAILLTNALIQIAINVYYAISMGSGQEAKDAVEALIGNIWVQTFTALAQNAVLVLLALAYLRTGKEPVTLDRLGLKFDRNSPKLFIAGMGIELVLFLPVIALLLLIGATTYEEFGITKFGLPGVLISLLLMLVATLSVGVGEEVLFRGYLQRRLTGLYGIAIALPAASAVFILVHTLPYFLFGKFTVMAFVAIIPITLILGYLFYKTGSLWLCIGLHFLQDFMALGIFFSGNMFNGSSPLFLMSDPAPIVPTALWLGNWGDLVSFAVMLVVLMVIIAVYRRGYTVKPVAAPARN